MLQAMRTGASSIILKSLLFGLLLLASVGLALMDYQGMFRRGFHSTDVASIDGQKISAQEFSRHVQTALREQRIPETEAVRLGMPQQLLSQEINDRIFTKAARDLGLIVDDKTAAGKIREILKPSVERGIPEKQALDQMLLNLGINEQGLVSAIKSQIATDQVLRALSTGAKAPQKLVQDAMKYRYEQRQGSYFKISAADAGAIADPSEEELKAYYATIASRYVLPEYRSFGILLLDKAALIGDAAVSEEEARKYYDDHISNYTTPETRVISQIVSPTEEDSRAVYESANQSKDLKQAAAALSGKAHFIAAQSYAEKDMPVELSPAAFKGAEGAVLQPVKSPLGWHVLHIEKIAAGKTVSFESARAEISRSAAQDQGAEKLYERANEVDDMIASGKTLAEVAQKFGLKATMFEKLDARGNDAFGKKLASPPPAFDKILSSVFSLQQGEASQMIETPDGGFAIAETREIFPSAEQPLDKIRTEIISSWKEQKRNALLDEKAGKITERLRLGDSFEKIAQELGKTIEPTGLIGRDPSASKLDRNMLAALFSLGEIDTVTNAGGADAVTILKLTGRRIDVPKNIKQEDASTIENILNRSFKNDILEQYRQGLIAKYDVTINDRLLKDMFSPKQDDSSLQ